MFRKGVASEARFLCSVTRDPAMGLVYLKLVNASSIAQPLDINLSDAGNIAKTGTLATLSGVNEAETNTIADPKTYRAGENAALKRRRKVRPYAISYKSPEIQLEEFLCFSSLSPSMIAVNSSGTI